MKILSTLKIFNKSAVAKDAKLLQSSYIFHFYIFKGITISISLQINAGSKNSTCKFVRQSNISLFSHLYHSVTVLLTWKFTTYSKLVRCTLMAKGSVG